MRRLKEAFFNVDKDPIHHDGQDSVAERSDPRLFTRASITGLTGIIKDAEKIVDALAGANYTDAAKGASSIRTAADELLSMIE